VVWHRDAPQTARKLGPHGDARVVAVSPDGRFVATGSHNGSGVRVWDAETGQLLKELLPQENFFRHLAFSPDGKWLATSGRTLRLWSVPSWQEGPLLFGEGYAFVYAPDGKWLAHETGAGAIRLLDLQTGQEMAKLEDPEQRIADSIALSPDGARLAAIYGANAVSFHVWELCRIREELAHLDLDSDRLPSFPPERGSRDESPTSLTLIRADAPPPLSRAEQARADLARYRRAQQANPDDADLWNAVAWVHVMAPPEVRDTKEMLTLAEKAAERAPGDPLIRNTLGAAYYRAGQFKEAIAALEENVHQSADAYLALDLYFLAMSWQALDDPVKARLYYDWAERWPQKLQDSSPQAQAQVEQLRSEAAAALGITQ
jgi:tetratricopeptide (TPR) repeat protein